MAVIFLLRPCWVVVVYAAVGVAADEGANPAHVAADLLSQAEHGPDSQVVLLALPGVDLDAVQLAVQRQCDELPRNETARKALSHSCAVQVREAADACVRSDASAGAVYCLLSAQQDMCDRIAGVLCNACSAHSRICVTVLQGVLCIACQRHSRR